MRIVNVPLLLLPLLLTAPLAAAKEISLNGHTFTVADNMTVEHIAGSPLVDRPVSADFDELGRLYVTDSSGSNDPTAKQVVDRPHRIMRMVDTDGDGTFDSSTVFADKLMFPEGAMWFDGSLYVAAPPEIWKFTDTDDDGISDKREVWFNGKTLTGCANDLHGPYLGPDGWIYWCKGAFAEQTYDRPGQTPLKTSASHIFRRRPEGGPIESVMTGGMDNPVELVFTPGGERIFTTTFLTHPRNGQRDGLIHAIYGGVYGKDHRVLEGHPRTGDLMPVLSHLGAAAPSGLVRLESDGLGSDYRNTVLASSFNLHKVIRHTLSWNGAALKADLSDLIVSDNLDFHPTDVLEDADGSVIVVDTGGWFKLCCPTSQLEKADVLGGIYRIRKNDHQPPADPRGRNIAWNNASDSKLVKLLGDDRHYVRNRARRTIGKRAAFNSTPLQQVLQKSDDANHRLEAVWALTWLAGDVTRIGDATKAADAVRLALKDEDATVRQAALHSISVRQDRDASPDVEKLLWSDTAHNQRAAAEALGRIGSAEHVKKLLGRIVSAFTHSTAKDDGDRVLEHSLIYAAIELNDSAAARALLKNNRSIYSRRGALIALDQMESGDLKAEDIEPYLMKKTRRLSDTAWWIAEHHPEWADTVAKALRQALADTPSDPATIQKLADRLRQFAGNAAVQKLLADAVTQTNDNRTLQRILLQIMADSRQKPMPAVWNEPVVACLSGPVDTRQAALRVLNQLSAGKLSAKADVVLRKLAADRSNHAEIRLRALNLIPAGARKNLSDEFRFVCSQLNAENEITNRSLAVDYVKSTPLDNEDLKRVATELPVTGPLELQPVLTVFQKSKDKDVGQVLVASLLKSPAATSLFPDRLKELVNNYGDDVSAKAEPLLERIRKENNSKLERIEKVLALLPKADIRRGLRVFQSSKASCLACHQRGYIGGRIGPGLNNIGRIRSERDLLESILFPSLSFVRSYEPVTIVTTSGRIFNGLIRDETSETVTLQIDAKKQVDISKNEIEERHQGTVSIMPAGLEKQLSPQDMADLIKYLKEG